MRLLGRPFRALAALVVLSVALLVAPLTRSSAQEQPRRGGTLIVALDGDPASFNPGITTSIPTQLVGGQVYDLLIRVDHDLKVYPELADSWDIGKDGMSYTFHLRKDVKWHDGKPFTADDVKYSMLEISRRYNGIAAKSLGPVDSIDVPDPSTIVIKLKYPYPPFFPWSLAMTAQMHILPKHLYEGTDPTRNDFNFKPVGTGPFVFKEYVKGDHITLERNPNYFKPGQPYLDRLVFKIIPDASARVIALQKGEVDYLPYFTFPPSAAKELMKDPNLQVALDTRPAYGQIIAFFNVRNAPLKVKEVRQATSYAVDLNQIAEKALDGLMRPGTGPVSSRATAFYNTDVRKYTHDPARADQLLDQAGFPKKANGTRFSLRMSYQNGAEGGAIPSAAEIMREQLKAVGIDVQLQPMDYAAFQDTSWIKWDFDITILSGQTGPDPTQGLGRFYPTANIKHAVGTNLMGYSNPRVDDLLKAAERELDENKRASLYKDAQALIVDDPPAIWLWDKLYPIGFKKTAHGLPGGAMHFEVFDQVWLSRAPGRQGHTTTYVVAGVIVLLLAGGAFIFVRRLRAV